MQVLIPCLIYAVYLCCSRVQGKGVVVPTKNETSKLIVVVVGGFRWNYFDRHGLKLKAYPRFVKNGVRAPYLNPVFPTLSYPNIMSFVTGLYPEHHGFVDDFLWDNKTDEVFEMIPAENSTDPMWWNDAEPVFVTAEKSQKKTALYWWAGCEVEMQGQHPTICERIRYEKASPEGKNDFLKRIDDVVEMFKPSPTLDMERLDLAMFYTSWVDHAGHYHGIESKEMTLAIQDVDEVLDYLLTSLKKSHLDSKVNIMVVSDHGMGDITNATYITLDKYAADIKYQINTGSTSALVPINGKEDKLYNDIKNDKIPGLHIYKAQDIPESFHLKHAPRIAPIVLFTDSPNFIKGLQDSNKRMGDTFDKYYGQNGYDSKENQDMKSIFLAMGPDFKSGFKTNPIDIIDLYNVMCHLLKIDPLPNNGTWEHAEPMMRTAADGPFHSAAAHVVEDVVLILSSLVLTKVLVGRFSLM